MLKGQLGFLVHSETRHRGHEHVIYKHTFTGRNINFDFGGTSLFEKPATADPPTLMLPRPGAVAITVTTTALDRVSGVVCGDACVPGFGCGLARESVGGVGFEVGL